MVEYLFDRGRRLDRSFRIARGGGKAESGFWNKKARRDPGLYRVSMDLINRDLAAGYDLEWAAVSDVELPEILHDEESLTAITIRAFLPYKLAVTLYFFIFDD